MPKTVILKVQVRVHHESLWAEPVQVTSARRDGILAIFCISHSTCSWTVKLCIGSRAHHYKLPVTHRLDPSGYAQERQLLSQHTILRQIDGSGT
jgi:hypothetical protein